MKELLDPICSVFSNIVKRIILLLIAFSACFSYAQDIEVKKFEPMAKDQTAVLSPRKDINGVTCGLVKVQLKEPGAEFEGNVMGDVQFTGSEYLVYLPNGTKRLGIKHPDYLPTTIVFADYGIKRIASSTTYELKLKTNKKKAKIDNSKKGMAVFNIKPSNSMLLVDGQIADGSGGAYTLSLPYGTHYYTVKLKDFSINNQSVHIDKDAKNFNVDLTEFFAKVDVSCKTVDAEILINDEQKGVGKWDGMMIPGKYIIEAQKDGCHSQTRQIELKDNDTIKVDFTALKTITGSLRVDYEPAGADVLLNGKKVGVTPLVLKELPVGEYHMEIWKEYYVKEFVNVKIAEDQEWNEKGELKTTLFGRLVLNAEKDLSVCRALAEYYMYGAANGWRYGGYGYSCSSDSIAVPFDPIKGIQWYKKYYERVIKESDSQYDYKWDEAKEKLAKYFQSSSNDAEASLRMLNDTDWEFEDQCKYHRVNTWYESSFAPLAWHYFYGIGCKKDIEKAKQMMRWACFEDGTYCFPSYNKLIKEMGLEKELRYKKQEVEDENLYE